MAQTATITINFRGGIVSPGYLLAVMQAATDARIEQVRFGLRQQLIMNVPQENLASFSKACRQKEISYQTGTNVTPNMVSSYPAAGIFSTEGWLREGVYKDVFGLFRYEPQLQVNICDSSQQLVPLFTGHINWVSSPFPHFWYLYIRLPGTQTPFCWRELIYTNDIAALSHQLEKLITRGITTEQALYAATQTVLTCNTKRAEHPLQPPAFSLPYYEGFNREGNTWWLGIYRRDELFPVSFLADLCRVCLQTGIGQLYTTPWKSIVIKGIESGHRPLWDGVLGKYRINVRHAANELNWRVEDEEGLRLKRLVIRHFDKEDVRTYGLCFAVQTRQRSSVSGSVVICKEARKNPDRLASLDRYSILYKKDFNPYTTEEILFRKNIPKDHVGTYLVSLCKLFYEQAVPDEAALFPTTGEPKETTPVCTTHQCMHCLTIYDEKTGDAAQQITAGTRFGELPATYACSVCEAGVEDFRECLEPLS
ncbi:MAG: rubredoxin [Williamsia sp.]|nr:rubredoxin [Williamsia sp.]